MAGRATFSGWRARTAKTPDRLPHRPAQRVRDGVQALWLADQECGPVVGLPAVRAGPVEMAQVVEALIRAPPLHPARKVEDGVPVHPLVRAEVTGRLVLESRVLPLRHRFIMPQPRREANPHRTERTVPARNERPRGVSA